MKWVWQLGAEFDSLRGYGRVLHRSWSWGVVAVELVRSSSLSLAAAEMTKVYLPFRH